MLNSIFNENDAYYRTGIAGTIEDAATAADDDEFVQSAFNDNPKRRSAAPWRWSWHLHRRDGASRRRIGPIFRVRLRYFTVTGNGAAVVCKRRIQHKWRQIVQHRRNSRNVRCPNGKRQARRNPSRRLQSVSLSARRKASASKIAGKPRETANRKNRWAWTWQKSKLTRKRSNSEAKMPESRQLFQNFRKKMAPDAAALKRRSLGAKVSEIVALYEEAFRRSSK